MGPPDKPLAWLHGEVRTPPLSTDARRQAGYLLRRLQQGDSLAMPESRPMPAIGARVHELRLSDIQNRTEWRIIYRIDQDVIVIAEVFRKTTRTTPNAVISVCKRRLANYDGA